MFMHEWHDVPPELTLSIPETILNYRIVGVQDDVLLISWGVLHPFGLSRIPRKRITWT